MRAAAAAAFSGDHFIEFLKQETHFRALLTGGVWRDASTPLVYRCYGFHSPKSQRSLERVGRTRSN